MYTNWEYLKGKNFGGRVFHSFGEVHPYRLHNKSVASSPLVKLLRLLTKEADKYVISDEDVDWFDSSVVSSMLINYQVKIDTLLRVLQVVEVSDLDTIAEMNLLKVQDVYQYYVDLFGRGYTLTQVAGMTGIKTGSRLSLEEIDTRIEVLEFVLGFDIDSSYRPNIDGELEG